MRNPRLLALLGVVTAFLVGCAGHRASRHTPLPHPCATVFRIDNQGPDGVDVFLHRGVLVRLGTVSAWRSARLTALGGATPGTGIRLIARPIAGGRSISTDELWLASGDHVRWTITQPFEYSSITAVIEHASEDVDTEECARGRPRSG